jgi:hypothetical protein
VAIKQSPEDDKSMEAKSDQMKKCCASTKGFNDHVEAKVVVDADNDCASRNKETSGASIKR